MNRYLFSDREFEFIGLIKSKVPKKIWFNVIEYILDYEDSYIKIAIKPTRELSLNRISQTYEMTIGFSTEKEKFSPNELSILISENERLEDIYIVRTLIYHRISQKPDNHEKKSLKLFLNSIISHKKQDFSSSINNIGGITYDYVVHPNSTIPQDIKPEHINLVDVGVLILLNNKYIKAYSEDNNDDFCNYQNIYVYENDDFVKVKEKYDLIKTE